MNKILNTLRKFQIIMKTCIRTGVFIVFVLFSFNTLGNPLAHVIKNGREFLNRTLKKTPSTEDLKLIYGDNGQFDPEITFQLNIEYGRVAKEIFGDDFFDKERFLSLWREDPLFRTFIAARGLKADRLVALGPNFLIELSRDSRFIPSLTGHIDNSLKRASYDPYEISPDDEFWNLATNATSRSVVFQHTFSDIVRQVIEDSIEGQEMRDLLRGAAEDLRAAEDTIEANRNFGNRADRDW